MGWKEGQRPEATASGYAVYHGGDCLVATVANSARGAMINFIVTEGFAMVYNKASDEEIYDAFRKFTKDTEWTLRRVLITPDPDEK